MAPTVPFPSQVNPRLRGAWNRLQSSLMALVAGAAGSSTLVYRPGARTGAGVYGTWAELVAAALATDGAKVVFVDDKNGTPTVPAGNWNLGTYTTLRGRQQGAAGGTCELQIEDGAKIAGVYQIRALRVVNNSTTNVMESNDAQGQLIDSHPTYLLAEGASIRCDGGAPFFAVTSGDSDSSSVWWLLDDSALLESESPNVLIAQGRGTRLDVYMAGSSVAQEDTVAGLPNTIATIYVVNAAAKPDAQARATAVMLEQAERVFFDDALVPHVGSSDVQRAIQAIATRVRWGTGSPEAAVTADPGTIYLDLAGGKDLTLYVKESNTDNTGWIAK